MKKISLSLRGAFCGDEAISKRVVRLRLPRSLRSLAMTTCSVLLLLGLALTVHADPHAYPVPYVEKDHKGQGINFVELPASGTIKIFTINGEEVARLDIPQSAGIREWKPVVNSSGKTVQTGVYLYLVDGDNRQFTGKLVVIR